MTIQLTHRLSAAQEEQLWRLYQDEWWTAERTLEDVRTMLANSDVVFCLAESEDDLAGFARVLTDRVYKALVLDVIVASTWRDKGLGRRLMDAVLGHPDLADVRHFELYCKEEMVPFYEQWGFTADLSGVLFLRRS